MTRQTVAHYRLIRALGAGGMGEVYLAEDTKLGRRVALKILPDLTASDERARARLLREAQHAATLDHDNICTIFEVGHDNGVSFIAMQYIDGETLAARVQRKRLDVAEAAAIGAQIADALSAAHDVGIVHRDVKPQNVMLTSRGQAKVLDFGLAKLSQQTEAARDAATRHSLTAAGAIVGTTAYMSPEQLHGQAVDSRSDLFSLGIVLHEMVSGVNPFSAETTAGTVAAILTRESPPLNAASQAATEYARIVRRCLAKDKDERYPSARDLLADLNNLEREDISRASSLPLRGVFGKQRAWLWPAVATAVALAATTGYVLLQSEPAAPTIRSIAILPLTSSDGTAEYLGDGVSESLINSLSQLTQLKVIARATTFRYRGAEADLNRIRNDLGVDHIVSGRVTQQGDTFIVQVELTDVADGSQIWGDRYTRTLSDLFTVQEEIATEIASSLRLRLSGREQAGLSKRYTVNIDAYRHYLLGRAQAQQRTVAGLQKAVEYYRQAIALDANYALAYAGLTDAYTNLTPRGQFAQVEGRRQARAAAERALALDPDLAEAHAAIGQIHVYSAPYDFATGDRALRRAIELSPSWAIAHQYLGVSLLEQGRVDEALREWETAQDLDPLSPFIPRLVAHAHLVRRDYLLALTLMRRANQLGLGASFAMHSEIEIYLANDAMAEALQQIERIKPDRPGDPYLLFALAMVSAKHGQAAETQRITADLQKLGDDPPTFAFLCAKIHLALGQHEEALKLLEDALDGSAVPIVYPGAPLWDGVRQDPRFKKWLTRIGIPGA